MTEKQIIIDGVDVSGCEYYNKDDKTCREVNGNYDTDICEFDKCENSNCYYKQLARKEQECEELKKIINEAKNSKLDLKRQNEELQKENKRLREEREKAKNYNLEYGKLLIKATNKNNKLSKTLTEIKEIVEQQCNIYLELIPIDEYKDCEKCWQDKILQKISEVENEA